MEELKEPVKNSELHINAQNYPEGCYEELEKLKKQVEYATYEECQKAGFEKAFSDTVNILGFSCQEVIYKDKVLGYKLHIDYTNPME